MRLALLYGSNSPEVRAVTLEGKERKYSHLRLKQPESKPIMSFHPAPNADIYHLMETTGVN